MRRKKNHTVKKRNIQFHFCADQEEAELILARFSATGMTSRAAHLRRMAIDGCHVSMDLSDVNEMIRLLRNIDNNLKQLSQRAEETGNVRAADIEELRRRYPLGYGQRGFEGVGEVARVMIGMLCRSDSVAAYHPCLAIPPNSLT